MQIVCFGPIKINPRKGIKRIRKENGFSLIEVMIAVVLLMAGLLAIGSGEITTLTLNRRTSESMRAMAVAENIIDLMRRNSANPDALVASYNGMNTNNARIPNPITDANFDFNAWRDQVTGTATVIGISGTVAPGPFPCGVGGPLVTTACGNIALGPGVMSGVTVVTVTIVWPARPTGITLNTTIVS